MTPIQHKIIDLCGEVDVDCQQFTIDFLEDVENYYFHYKSKLQKTTETDIGALIYKVENIIKIMNPVFTRDIELLSELKNLLYRWESDIKNNTNQYEIM